jgi:pyrroloquinoline quinone (PQQ) biosynthesis protein C
MISLTPHPAWLEDVLKFLQPYEDRVINSRIFRDLSTGKLTLKQFQGALINFYPLIEGFPQYMALNLAKVPAGDLGKNKDTRDWLIANIDQERLHTVWWKRFALGFSVRAEDLKEEIYPPPAMDAINNYLWRICLRGSLAEGVAALNYGVEGPTGQWTKNVISGFEHYRNREGIDIAAKTLEWIVAHANYDDKHPIEALEIVKAYARTDEERLKVRHAAKRALEYYAFALDACYDIFSER